MSNQSDERLLRAILAAARIDEQSLDRALADERLGEYVERELAGEDVLTLMPDVALFIATDAEFAHAYRSLRDDLIALAREGLPEIPFDMAALEASVNGMIVISPDDLARPIPQATPADEERAYLRLLLPYWQQHLPVQGGLFMSGGSDAELEVELPEQDEATTLSLVLSQEADGSAIDGRVLPLRHELIGSQVRLYRLDLQPEPTLSVVGTSRIDRFGRFAFERVPAGRYALAVVIDEEIIGTAWLDL